eukprot:CAMPEP_0168352674 /NCGR_PEP_ID=MMETSP0213-20121227/22731_1 /TAXON_ID=151035 /ORGANISM="Euplotes harpa, Strain FSP1.4" /LENGTH=271 /DNA_ID=CAMNT_0008364009 /DNA_START=656 /DNA_END=1471 /DNA_ORIENTATION=+
MEDTELYMLTPILESLSKIEDVRTIIRSIVFEDKVLFNKAANILQGGKIRERAHSQQPKLLSQNASEPEVSATSNVQSGELTQTQSNAEPEGSTNPSEAKSNALCHFKSYQNVNRKSTTGKLAEEKRCSSQKRNLAPDENTLHYLPMVDNSRNKPTLISAANNGWVAKTEKEYYSTSDTFTKHVVLEDKKAKRVPYVLQTSEITLKRNEVKTSSLTRSPKFKFKDDKSSTSRYSILNGHGSEEFKRGNSNQDLILIGSGKHSRNGGKDGFK